MLQHGRKIATILAADVVGYSRLMSVDDEGTLVALKLRRAIFNRLVQEFEGREFGSVGDSLMAEFPSAVNAVRCAQAIKQAVANENAPLPPDRCMALRIGLNLGDVIEENATLFGDGVNVAARLQALAAPGGILISRAVYEQVKRRVPATFTAAGVRHVKNIPDAIATYEVLDAQARWRPDWRRSPRWLRRALAIALAALSTGAIWWAWDGYIASWWTTTITRTAPGSSGPADVATPAFTPPAHSVAVLPFVNMSGDAQQDYFSEGLSEELLNSLSRITQLQVAARTSSFAFKGKQVDVADIAHTLNVGAILEGSVRKDGARVRITAQLINAVTGFHLWSQTYDRDLRDILALQTEIASAVTNRLQATLLGESDALIEIGGTKNPRAFDAYLRGQNVGGTDEEESVPTQIAEFSEAIRLDPSYAKAYAAKAIALTFFAGRYADGPAVHESYAEARAAAEKALALAPELGEAHAALASVLDEGFADYALAAVEYERALVLSPGDARVLGFLALFFSAMGRSEAAVTIARRATVLDPLNAKAYNYLGGALHFARRDREAIEAYNRAESLNPRAGVFAAFRGHAQLALGEFEAARASCATPPVTWFGNTCLAVAYNKLRRQSDADAALAAVIADKGDDASFQYAMIYAQWGNIPMALQRLETAYRMRDPGLVDLKAEPLLDPLRQEPRYQEIERKLKFPT